jgi:hypothetical protein
MPKRRQKREGRSEEKRRAKDTSSSRERADLRGRGLSPSEQLLAGTSSQDLTYRDN